MTKARDLSQVPNASLGFKNRIINGAFDVWQRATSFTLSSGVTTYTADRFYVNTTGGAGTVSRVAGTGGFRYAMRITGASGVTVNATPGLKLRAQWSSATLIKRGTDTWVAIGDLVS
jgi:hypothetical protein